MSNLALYYFQVASTLSVVLPLAVGFWRFRQLDVPYRLFVLFLLIGLITDLSGWYFYLTKNIAANEYARQAYDLFEAVFITWLIRQFTFNTVLKKTLFWLWPVLLLFWATHFFFADALAMFKSTTQIFFAFAASYCILQITETTPKISRLLSFWILLGIFFYCFTTYFIMGLLSTKLSGIWYMHNAVNIITNLIYLIGFLRSRSMPDRSASVSVN